MYRKLNWFETNWPTKKKTLTRNIQLHGIQVVLTRVELERIETHVTTSVWAMLARHCSLKKFVFSWVDFPRHSTTPFVSPRRLCIYLSGTQRSFTARSVSDPLSSIPSSSILMTQTREAIRRDLRIRHSDDRIRTRRGISNNIRMATATDNEAAAWNSLAHFVFLFPVLRHAPNPATCYCVPTLSPLSFVSMYTSRILRGRPRKSIHATRSFV